MKGRRGSPRRTLAPEAAEEFEFRFLQEQAGRFHVSLGQREESLLRGYLSELLRWNQKFNLISVTSPEELLVRHVLDSLVPVPLLQDVKVLVDVGSGAGFPGIPIKIVRPSLRVYLLDARRKRTSFLQYVIAKLGLEGIDAVWARLGASAGPGCRIPERADCVLTRASGSEEAILKVSDELLRAGGRIVLMKGAVADEQRLIWDRWAKEGGRSTAAVHAYRLPGLSGERHLVVFE